MIGADVVDGIAGVEIILRDDSGKGPRRMAWQDHYLDCTSEDLFEQALNQFYDTCDQALEQRLASLTLEIEKVDQETKVLNCKLKEVEAETARVQQGQQTTHVISQIQETLGQL